MQPKSFVVLALVAGASAALAAGAVINRDLPISAAASTGPLSSGLAGRLNYIRTVKVSVGGKPLTLQAGDKGWALVEKGGYPVAPNKVRALVLAVANLQPLEPRTADPGRLGRLDLADPAAEGSAAKRIELLDETGTALADLTIGKRSFGLYGGGRDGVYVRRTAENQAWLAAGEIDLPGDPADLLEREVMDVPAAEIAEITLDLDAATPIVLSRATPETPSLAVAATIPEGRTVDGDKVERIAGALSTLTLQDVRPAAELPAGTGQRRSRFQTFDGLVVEAAITRVGDGDDAERWAVFKVSAEAAAGDRTQGTRDSATALGGKLEGWAFKLSPFVADRLSSTLDDLLAERPGAS